MRTAIPITNLQPYHRLMILLDETETKRPWYIPDVKIVFHYLTILAAALAVFWLIMWGVACYKGVKVNRTPETTEDQIEDHLSIIIEESDLSIEEHYASAMLIDDLRPSPLHGADKITFNSSELTVGTSFLGEMRGRKKLFEDLEDGNEGSYDSWINEA